MSILAPPTTATLSTGSKPRADRREAWKNVAGYVASAVAALAAAVVVLQLWRADLRVPLYDQGDSLMAQMFIRNVQETGWFLDNPRLGAPGALDLRDFPQADALHFAVVKLLLYVCRDPVVVFNLFLLLPFPLTALSAYFVFRRLRLGRVAALAAGVLYACAPYHFLRIQGHACLAAYYLSPPMLWLALRVCLGRNPLLRADPSDGRPRWRFGSWEAAAAAVICILTGLAGVYYAFFSCFFLLAAGARDALRQRRWKPVASAGLLVLLIVGAVAAALAPSLVHFALHGGDAAVASRLPGEADYYGLSIGEMMLPIPHHRIGRVAKIVQHYLDAPRRPTGEWPFEPLGVVAAVGFIYLVGRFLLRRRDKTERAEDGLAFLNLAAVLLGTVGGFGAVFAFWVSPTIRCYNRLSICIAFFALAGLFLLIHRIASRFLQRPRWKAAYFVGLIGLLAFGLFDQTSPNITPSYAANRKEFTDDEDFARRMEAALPAGSMVYQTPYFPFPECPYIANLGPYELLRPFLHTRTLRFSYGAMIGRETARWLEDLSKQPPPEVVEKLAFADFRGVYLDRAGFADGGAGEEAELSRLLGVQPLVSRGGRQTFFDMTPYVRSLRARFSDQEWEDRKDQLLHPVELRWAGTFFPPEQSPAEGAWRWCGPQGELHVVNPSHRSRRVILTMQCSGLWDQTTPSRLVVDGAGTHRELTLSADHAPLEIDLTAPPGDQVLRFSCDGRGLATETGRVVFRLWNFEYRVEE